MKKQTLIFAIGLGLLVFWYLTKNNKFNSGLIGKQVRAKYIGVSQPDNPIGAADMGSPIKYGDVLSGIVRPQGLEIIVWGIAPIPKIIPNGKFEIISIIEPV